MSIRWDGAGPGHHVERRAVPRGWLHRDTWEAAMDNDPLRAPGTDAEPPIDDLGRPGMVVVWAGVALIVAGIILWWVTR